MTVFRRIGLSLAALFFSLCISGLTALVGLYAVFGTPQPLIQSLRSSGIYTNLAHDLIAQQSGAGQLVTGDPAVQQALEKSFSPTFLQSSVEQIINNTYAWAQGNSAKPDLSIDLAPVKTSFADNLATYVQQKLASLPPCSQATMPSASIDTVLDLTCLPKGTSLTDITNSARQDALTSDLFPAGNTLDLSTLKDPQGRSVTDQLAIIPVFYHYFVLSLFILPVLMLLFAAGIVFWSATKRSGWKRIAWLLISTGITGIIIAVAGVWLLHEAVMQFGSTSASATLQDKLLVILETLVTDLRIWWIGFGAGYTIVGVVILIIVRLARPKVIVPSPANSIPSDTLPAPVDPLGPQSRN